MDQKTNGTSGNSNGHDGRMHYFWEAKRNGVSSTPKSFRLFETDVPGINNDSVHLGSDMDKGPGGRPWHTHDVLDMVRGMSQ